MKKYSIWQAFFLSFFAKDLYMDVAFNWKGICLIYVILLMGFVNIARGSSIYVALSSSAEVKSMANRMFSQFPTMTFRNGVLSTDKESPCVIYEPQEGKEAIIVIDTEGKIKPENIEAKLLLTKTELVFLAQGSNDKQTSVTYENLGLPKDMVLTQDVLKDLAYKITAWFLALVYFIAWVKDIIVTWIVAAIIAVVVKNVAKNLNWQSGLRLSIIAMTPAHLILTFVYLLIEFRIVPAISNLVFIEMAAGIALGLAYLIFAVKSVSTEIKPA
jgi:hypothetical protein